MRPTTEEQLLGVQRLLDELAVDTKLSDESALLLRDATKQLRRVSGSVGSRSAFLRWDSATMIALLNNLVPVLPTQVQLELAESIAPVGSLVADDLRNEQLRRLMIAVIDALPDGVAGDRARLLIANHLRLRAAANPALHKQPQTPWEQSLGAESVEPSTPNF